MSTSSKRSSHYLNNTNRFDMSSKGPSKELGQRPDEEPLLKTSKLFVSLRFIVSTGIYLSNFMG